MSFATDLWDQFDEVQRQVSAGKEFTTAAADFFHKRAAIERDYARKLQALVKSTEKEVGTLGISWVSVKEETETIAKKHGDIAEYFTFQVEETLQNFLKETKKPRTTLKEQGRKIIKDVQTAESKVTVAKTAFEQARKKQDEVKEEYERAAFTNQQSPAVEKLSKKMRADAKKSALCDKKYHEAVDACRQLQDRYHDEEMPRILSEYEQMETTRMEKSKVVLESYVELQRSISPVVLSSCDKMSALATGIDLSSDLNAFINGKKTGAKRPERVEYEPYNGDLGRCMKQIDGTVLPSSSVAAPVSDTSSVVSSASVASPVAAQQTRQAPPAAQGMSKCKGLFDYNTDDPNELSFKQGDIISVLQKDPSGWWQGELNGRIGVFPSVDWVEEILNGAPVAPKVRHCRALYDYAADNQYEITIKAGDIITIEGDEAGWYSGKNPSGQFGRYPSNYVEEINQ